MIIYVRVYHIYKSFFISIEPKITITKLLKHKNENVTVNHHLLGSNFYVNNTTVKNDLFFGRSIKKTHGKCK